MELPTQAATEMRARTVALISLITFPVIAVLTGGIKVTAGSAELDCARPAVWVAPDGRTIEAGLPSGCTARVAVAVDGWKIGVVFADQTPAGQATTAVEPGKQTKLLEPAIGCGPHQLDVRLASEPRPAHHDSYGPGLLSAFEVFPPGYDAGIDLGKWQLTILAGEACAPPPPATVPPTSAPPPPPVAAPPTTTTRPAIKCPTGICDTVPLPPATTTSTTTTVVPRVGPQLPNTGAPIVPLSAVGALCLAAGVVLRRQTNKETP